MRYHNGAWQKVNFVVLADKSLQRVENVFECVVKLPQTAYTVRRTMLYTPSKCITVNTIGSGAPYVVRPARPRSYLNFEK